MKYETSDYYINRPLSPFKKKSDIKHGLYCFKKKYAKTDWKIMCHAY